MMNITQLIFLLPKLYSIFFIIVAFCNMQYKFKKCLMLEVLEKLIIAVTNPLVCYLNVEVSYAKPFMLINKLIIISIEFEISGKTSCTYDGSIKSKRKIRPG